MRRTDPVGVYEAPADPVSCGPLTRPGQVIGGRFELRRLAGSGGMGEVFQALDRDTGRSVAVKVLTGSVPGRSARLEREAQALAWFDHPAIVRHVAHGLMAGGRPYLVMEWLEGEELGAVLARRKLSVQETLVIGARVADALGALHARSVVHRDVKPSNIFLVGGDCARRRSSSISAWCGRTITRSRRARRRASTRGPTCSRSGACSSGA